MAVTDDFTRLLVSDIVVLRDVRQRRVVYDESGQFINDDGLLEDVQARGVLHPIIVDKQLRLIAGERRLEASRTLGLPTIICRFIEDIEPEEAEIVELSENLKRMGLPWRDEVAAITRFHVLLARRREGWTQEDTGRLVSYSQIKEAIRVARDLASPAIDGATSVRQAWNILTRRDERTRADAKADIAEMDLALFAPSLAPLPSAGASSADAVVEMDTSATPAVEFISPPLPLPAASILHDSFLTWAPLYTGPRFNLIHCDFSFSVGLFGGAMSGRDRWESYDDSKEENFFEQLVICLCDNLDRLMTPSAHLFFWLPSDVHLQWQALELFRKLAPSLEFWPKPLVWHKTDNVGVLSDPKRRPRHVYESALVASREDRLIAQATSDCYGSQTDKRHHPSTKPEPMLRYFFQMFVDEHTRLLDPTCGSGSALRAAESLGAGYVLGLESNLEHYENATKALRSFRALRAI